VVKSNGGIMTDEIKKYPHPYTMTIDGKEIACFTGIDFAIPTEERFATYIVDQSGESSRIMDLNLTRSLDMTSDESMWKWFNEVAERYPVEVWNPNPTIVAPCDEFEFEMIGCSFVNYTVDPDGSIVHDFKCNELIVWMICPHGMIADTETWEMARDVYNGQVSNR
jgi:hypothetical protein